jgi:hypothetical protein
MTLLRCDQPLHLVIPSWHFAFTEKNKNLPAWPRMLCNVLSTIVWLRWSKSSRNSIASLEQDSSKRSWTRVKVSTLCIIIAALVGPFHDQAKYKAVYYHGTLHCMQKPRLQQSRHGHFMEWRGEGNLYLQ